MGRGRGRGSCTQGGEGGTVFTAGWATCEHVPNTAPALPLTGAGVAGPAAALWGVLSAASNRSPNSAHTVSCCLACRREEQRAKGEVSEGGLAPQTQASSTRGFSGPGGCSVCAAVPPCKACQRLPPAPSRRPRESAPAQHLCCPGPAGAHGQAHPPPRCKDRRVNQPCGRRMQMGMQEDEGPATMHAGQLRLALQLLKLRNTAARRWPALVVPTAHLLMSAGRRPAMLPPSSRSSTARSATPPAASAAAAVG